MYFDIPLHPHVYTNGHICLDLLGEGWTPIHSMNSVAISIQSMLAGNTLRGKLFEDIFIFVNSRNGYDKATNVTKAMEMGGIE